MSDWRLILDGENPAPYNMAADAFLFALAEQGQSSPVVRLYGWDRPSITIGYHQRLERAVAVGRLDGTPVVRRITGGRALLHDNGELTYAVAGNFSDYPVLGDSLGDSYLRIAEAIVAFYRQLGWPAEIAHRDAPVSLASSRALQKGCFAAVSRYEVLVFGQKAAAGSQRRGRHGLLQHGAVRLSPQRPHPAIDNAFNASDLPATPKMFLQRRELKWRLAESLAAIYGVSLVSGSFSVGERDTLLKRLVDFENLAPADF